MQTVQQNFASSLMASGLSPKAQFQAVKKFSYLPVKTEKFNHCVVDHVEYPIGGGVVLIATKATTNKGKVVYNTDIETVVK
jgi:hypothetical protein